MTLKALKPPDLIPIGGLMSGSLHTTSISHYSGLRGSSLAIALRFGQTSNLMLVWDEFLGEKHCFRIECCLIKAPMVAMVSKASARWDLFILHLWLLTFSYYILWLFFDTLSVKVRPFSLRSPPNYRKNTVIRRAMRSRRCDHKCFL